MTSKEFGKILQDKLTSEYGVELNVASKQQIYRSLALICCQMMTERKNTDSSEPVFFEHVNRVYPSETTKNYVNRVVFGLLQYVKMCGDPIAINHVSTAQ